MTIYEFYSQQLLGASAISAVYQFCPPPICQIKGYLKTFTKDRNLVPRGPFSHALEIGAIPALTKMIAASGNEIGRIVKDDVLFVRAFTNSIKFIGRFKCLRIFSAFRRWIFFGVPRLLSKREGQCLDLLGRTNSYPKSHFRLDLIGSFCSDDLTDLLSEQLINCRDRYRTRSLSPTFRRHAISTDEPACRVRLDCCERGSSFFSTSLQFVSNSHTSNWSSKWEAAWTTCGL